MEIHIECGCAINTASELSVIQDVFFVSVQAVCIGQTNIGKD
jgi:hypothetical protein